MIASVTRKIVHYLIIESESRLRGGDCKWKIRVEKVLDGQ